VSKRATVTEADMRRAIKAATESGLEVRECVMNPTEIRLLFGPIDENKKSDDNPAPKPW
jgi:hypothetical protein